MLDHEGDEDGAIVVGLNLDLAIEIKNEARNDGFIYLEKTLETDTSEHVLNKIGLVVGLFYDSPFVTISILNLSIERCYRRRSRREFRNFGKIVFGESNIFRDRFGHFHLNTIAKKIKSTQIHCSDAMYICL